MIEETQKLIKELINQIKILNEHLEDIKTMAAPWLGFIIKKKRKRNKRNERKEEIKVSPMEGFFKE